MTLSRVSSSRIFSKVTFSSHFPFQPEYSNAIRCSLKVTVNANWLPKRCCLDWFILEPGTAADKVFNKIENGAHKVFDTIGNKFRRLLPQKKPKA